MRRDKYPGKICLSVAERSAERAFQAIGEANRWADLIELRVDYWKNPILEPLLVVGKKPFIITNRRREEGGKYRGEERGRLAILQKAIDLGVAYVDVEVESERSSLRALMANKKNTRLILSFHDFRRTPTLGELRGLFERMRQQGADVVKIVTFARTFEDDLKILSLIPYARGRKKKIVAFCMGEKGKMSRIFAPLMGAAWTYASLDRRRASAPGQLTALELKAGWESLK